MAAHTYYQQLREQRMSEPGFAEAYEAARRAYELGKTVRELREARGWTQVRHAEAAGMTESALADLEAGGPVPALPVLERLAGALEADLEVRLTPRTPVTPRTPAV